MDFTCCDWVVVLYQSMECTFFAGDGPVMVEGIFGMVTKAVVCCLLPIAPRRIFLLVPFFVQVFVRSLDVTYGSDEHFC